ncbi:MAG: aminotransferase class I/II-fold pyridoxal phosphate-dependent enzyme [Actinomycetia bacterium]|nr:aminotransferase class I/II-fold pyridoxal phosphate-dependent enzyme [Actinomycetes bacterium]
MSFDFDRIVDRTHSNAIAVDGFREYLLEDPGQTLPCPDAEAIAMWVADMAFATAPVALEAMLDRVEHPLFGYTLSLDSEFEDAFRSWCRRRYGWVPDLEHCLPAPGIVPALYNLVDLVLESGDKVVVHTPAYEPFRSAVTHRGCELITSPLTRRADGRVSADLDQLAATLADPAVRMFILCHPHNPTGHAWSDDELRAMAELCFANGVLIVSDEIHCDLLRTGRRHTPLAKLFGESDQIVTCMSSSKTFNLAGLGLANVIIPNDEIRARWQDRHFPMVNPISLAAATAVFARGDEWLEELKSYLDANFALVDQMLVDRLPASVFRVPDATYLAWIDLGAYVPTGLNLTSYFAQRSGVLLEGGEKFVADGGDCIRLNLACPRSQLEEALTGIIDATLALAHEPR